MRRIGTDVDVKRRNSFHGGNKQCKARFKYGEKIKLSTGEIGIFEEYNETDRKNVIRIRKSVCKYK